MNGVYKIGVVVGVLFIYSLATLGVATIFTAKEGDAGFTFGIAWLIGMVEFLVLATYTLEKFGLWMG